MRNQRKLLFDITIKDKKYFEVHRPTDRKEEVQNNKYKQPHIYIWWTVLMLRDTFILTFKGWNTL